VVRRRRWSTTAYQSHHTVRRTFPTVADDLEWRIASSALFNGYEAATGMMSLEVMTFSISSFTICAFVT
jgi:hypothetical protein